MFVMHTRELLELASVAAVHHAALTEGSWSIPERYIERYWVFSKVRLDRWAWTLKGDVPFDRLARGTIEEIFGGEVLARVWAAVLAAYDRRRGAADAEPVAQSVISGHVDARCRAMRMLLEDPAIDARATVELNRLRRHADRLTEVLIAEVESPSPAGRHGEKCMARFSTVTPNPDLNSQIAASVVGSFPEGTFEQAGLCFPLWFARVMSAADDAQSMLDDLTQVALPSVSFARIRPSN